MIDGRDVGGATTQNNCGSWLAAMAAEQSPLMVADTSLSLASQLPQFFR
jgi:hypothetical protein